MIVGSPNGLEVMVTCRLGFVYYYETQKSTESHVWKYAILANKDIDRKAYLNLVWDIYALAFEKHDAVFDDGMLNSLNQCVYQLNDDQIAVNLCEIPESSPVFQRMKDYLNLSDSDLIQEKLVAV